MRRAIALVVVLAAALPATVWVDEPIAYRFSFPEPEHHWMQVEAAFAQLGSAPLDLRMSRSSPGRYALHDFAKNVYDVHVFGADGRELGPGIYLIRLSAGDEIRTLRAIGLR